ETDHRNALVRGDVIESTRLKSYLQDCEREKEEIKAEWHQMNREIISQGKHLGIELDGNEVDRIGVEIVNRSLAELGLRSAGERIEEVSNNISDLSTKEIHIQAPYTNLTRSNRLQREIEMLLETS